MNGGRLWVETSRPGATFALALPARGAQRGRDDGARVLVVDDEPQILRALEIKLRSAGYVVDTAATAKEALAQAAMRPPEAVILDLLLPDGSGTASAASSARGRGGRSRPLRGRDEKEKIAALDAGADDYVTKPFSGDELLARLRAALRRDGSVGRAGARDRRAPDRPREAPVTVGGEPVSLTPTEYDLLRLLAENEGSCSPTRRSCARLGPRLPRGVELPARLRLPPEAQDRARSARPSYILTEPGVGYRLVEPAVSHVEVVKVGLVAAAIITWRSSLR